MTNKDKGFRDGQKEKLIKEIQKDLTEEEVSRIKEQREFNEIKDPNSWTWKVAVHLDRLKRQLREINLALDKKLINIEELYNQILRHKAELKSGQIVTKIGDNNLTMTEAELSSYIKKLQWTKHKEVRSVIDFFPDIRGLVGHKDLIGEVIITEKEFDEIAEKTQKRLQEVGSNLFE